MARGHITEVDPDTGAVKVLPYCFVDDFGTVIGQAHGDIGRGCGAGLFIAGIEDARRAFRAINGRTDLKADLVDEAPAKEGAVRNAALE